MTLATSPASLETSLLEFFHRLRDARVPVSMVEVLDAFDCLRHVDLAERAQFRAALASTLIKRAEDQGTFDVLFDVCFPLTRAQPDTAAADGHAGELAPGHAGAGGGQAPPDAEPAAGGEPSTELLEALLEALRHDDEAAMAALAGLAVDLFGGMEGQPEGTERYFMYRIQRQLELYRLIQMAMAGRLAGEGAAADPLDARLERERLERRLEEFRRMLAERVRHRLAARTGTKGAAELYRERQLDEVGFLGASTTQLEELRQAVRPLARKLAARVAAKRRRRHRGRLDVRRTVRRSLQYGGVPVSPAFRARHATRPDLFVLADVSGSVVEFAEFTLSLLYAMSRELGRLRSFAFVDGIDELTGLLAQSERGLDLRATFARAEVVAGDGHSHYGQVLERFAERYSADVDGRSTLIVMGDARGNYRDPGVETLRQLRARSRRLYWLNPEPRRQWDTTDSVMHLYARHCDRVFEVANLRQLADCVYEIS
jgi:uncharacterized protein with von Willebrand factor type A (vWA) domain